MEKFRVGARVKFLDDIGSGEVTRLVDKDLVMVRTDDGFEYPVLKSELLISSDAEDMTGVNQEEVVLPQTQPVDEKKDIEKLLKRLAQKARAAGIHVIIATQKPSAEVINTVLRANLPAQLALRVRSAIESKVIMEESGAETLNGKGDAFLKADGKTTRLQCALFTQ